jgi:hypothetical protein
MSIEINALDLNKRDRGKNGTDFREPHSTFAMQYQGIRKAVYGDARPSLLTPELAID